MMRSVREKRKSINNRDVWETKSNKVNGRIAWRKGKRTRKKQQLREKVARKSASEREMDLIEKVLNDAIEAWPEAISKEIGARCVEKFAEITMFEQTYEEVWLYVVNTLF